MAKKGHSVNIEKETLANNYFRKVLYTGKNTQLVLMSLAPGEDIGEEVHPDTDQFFRVEGGKGKAKIDNTEYDLGPTTSVVVPQGAKHNLINVGREPLKLYSLYSPPHHKDKTIHKTKAEALLSKEHFDGKTTEKSLAVKVTSIDEEFELKKGLR
jgi:mannose-6-phosphate isomerase-like protein (cupin superfamily)